MKSRDNFRKNYYFISNPREKNSTTGYACVKINDIVKYDKNFIYQYYDADSTLHNIMVICRRFNYR